MKNYIVLLLAIFCALPIHSRSQNVKSFILTGQFKGLPDGTKVYLRTQEKDTIARTLSNGNRFVFKGQLPQDGRFHFIYFDSLVSTIGSKAIFLTNKPIEVYGAIGKREVEVKGSSEQEEYMTNMEITQKFVDELNVQLTKINEDFNNRSFPTMDSISRLSNLTNEQKASEYEKIREKLGFNEKNEKASLKLKNYLQEWLLKNNTSLYAPWLMKGHLRLFRPEQSKVIFTSFSPEVKDSYYGRQLKLDIEALSIVKGSVIPDFPLKNMQGKKVNIHNQIKGNKYTLIDCWASWCSPCRAEVPKLKEVYEKYKGKGLNILGVSSDKKEADWKKAVADDKTTWGHMLEIDGNVSKAFSLRAIPAYILVDSEGKLIAFDCAMSDVKNFGGSLRGEGLDKTLEGLLGK